MNAAICDDTSRDREEICTYLRRYAQEKMLDITCTGFTSGEELLKNLTVQPYQIIFLDIYMDGLSGIEVARQIRSQNLDTLLIFITTSRDHAVEGFEVNALHYLVKPLSYKDVYEALERCRKISAVTERYIEVKTGKTSERVLCKKIFYIEVYNKILFIHTNNEVLKTYGSLDELEHELQGLPFLRCHRSYLVNMEQIQDMLDVEFILSNNERVPMRRKGRTQIQKIYQDYLFKCLETLD